MAGRGKRTGERGKPVDWDQLRRTSAMLREVAAGSTPEEEKHTLKNRARKLAQERESKDRGTERIDVLEFLVSDEKYAIQLSHVREVVHLRELTPVPCTPSFVLGVMAVHGRIVSVIDIKRFFDLPGKGLTDLNKVVVLYDGQMEFGILADAVTGAGTISLADLQPSLPTLTGVREEYLLGITGDGVVALDGGKLLRDPKIVVHEEITE